MTSPGFSSRSSFTTVRQFPHRDEAVMSEMTPGFSNSTPEPEAETKVVEVAEAEDKAVRRAKSKPVTTK